MKLNKTINYEKVPAPQMKRSIIPIPFKNDLTAPMSKIVPVFVQEVLPGTSVKMRSAAQIRLLRPFKVPMFDYMKAQFFWFFTPYRVLSAYWEKFIAGSNEQSLNYGVSGGNPGDWSVDAKGDLVIPPLTGAGGSVQGIPGDKLLPGTLYDYMGIPIPKADDRVSGKLYYVNNSMPFRAYNMIYNEFFRDENLMAKVPIDYTVGYSVYSAYRLLDACKTRDYFTTAIIKPQKSNPIIVPGLQGEAPLNVSSVPISVLDAHANPLSLYVGTKNTDLGGSSLSLTDFAIGVRDSNSGADNVNVNKDQLGEISVTGTIGKELGADEGWTNKNVYADLVGVKAVLSSAEGISLNNLRTLIQINKWSERLAIGGSRYGEVVQAFFGTNPGDKRLQIPEFLGVGSIDINVQEVVQTTGEGTDLGVTGGRSNSVAGAGSWFKSFAEHGVLMCVMVIRQKQNTYQQGMPRMYSKKTRLDLYWPTFAFISYQPIYNEEIYKTADNVTGNKNREVFGYQMPYQEHRTMPNQVHGDLLSVNGDSALDFWDLADYYDQLPTLTSTFITSTNANLNRALLGEQSSDRPFVVNFRVNAEWTLPMPVNAVPGLMDHF